MSSSVSVTVMGVVIVFNRVFWFCSRWPMVVDRDLSRYLMAQQHDYVSDMLLMGWDRMAFASVQYTIITYFSFAEDAGK